MLKATLVVFFLLKLAATATVSPSVYPDGKSYRVPGSWLDFSMTSLGGYSVRPWGATIWMALWPGDHAIAIAQALLSFAAWTVLAVAASRCVRSLLVQRLLVVALLIIPCTAQIANWDAVMQGDSVSISTAALALGLLLHFVLRPSWGRAAGFVAAALWFSMTRPNVLVVLVAWAVGLLVIAAVRRPQALLWGSVAVALLVISGYSYAYNVRSDDRWTDAFGASRTTIAYAYVVASFDPVAPAVIADLRRSDAPACMIPPSPDVPSGRGGITKWAETHARNCPGGNDWVTKHWMRWWASWLAHHPGAAARILDRILPDSVSPSVWGTVYSPVPDGVARIFFGSPALPQAPRHGVKSYRNEPILLWLGVALGLMALGRVRRRFSPGGWAPDALLGLTVAGALGAAVSSALLVQTAGFEVAQESLAATALMTAAAVIAVGWAADRLLATPVEDLAVAEPESAADPL